MPLTIEEKRARQREYSKRWKERHHEEYCDYLREYFRKCNEQRYPARKWTLEEDLIVLDPNMKEKELARLLKRSWSSIRNRKHALKVMFEMHMA